MRATIYKTAIKKQENGFKGNFRTSKGTIDCTVVHPREVFKGAILLNSANIILTHNHPTGNPTPSEEDIELTKRLVECGELLGIKVLDHIITGDGVFHSLREHSQM